MLFQMIKAFNFETQMKIFLMKPASSIPPSKVNTTRTLKIQNVYKDIVNSPYASSLIHIF